MVLTNRIMKKILLLSYLLPYFIFAQWSQVGGDIDGDANLDYFGFSTSINSDGSIIAVGARAADGSATDAGLVRVFENIAGIWTQIGADIDGEAANDWFGYSVSLNNIGNIIAIGGIFNDDNGTNAGHVRVFENIAGIWTQIGSDINGEAANDTFGVSVSLNGNGNILAVGAGGGTGTGYARIFENIAGVWTQIGADINGEAAGDVFGQSTSLNNNGNIVAIGARNNDGNGSNSGHVRVFENIAGMWTQIGADIDGEAAEDLSGQFLDINSAGNIVAIGARFNDGNGTKSGHVRVFENIAGVWSQIGADIDGEALGDELGWGVCLSSDGTIVSASAVLNDANGTSSGHVRVYKNMSGVWTQIDSDLDGEVAGDRFGASIGLSADGSTLVVGAIFADGNAVDSGYVKVFNNSSLDVETIERIPLKVYPNPSADFFNIELGKIYQEVKISVYNIIGRKIKIEEFNDTENITLDIQHFPSGIYLASITADGIDSTFKFVVQ